MAEVNEIPVKQSERVSPPPVKDLEINHERRVSDDYERYFLAKRPQLVTTLNASYDTNYGQKKLQPLKLNSKMNYGEFASKVPTVDPSAVKDNPKDFLKGDLSQMIVVHSGGTSGTPKEFYWPTRELNVKFEKPLEDRLLNSEKPVFIRGSWDATDFSAIENGINNLQSDIKTFKYSVPTEAIKEMENHGMILLVADITSFRAFMYDMDKMLAVDPNLATRLAGKEFFVDLNSEPVSAREINEWHAKLITNFKLKPNFSVSYGQTDTGNLGLYVHTPGDTEKDMKYRVVSSRLAEVLNSHGEIVTGEKGDLIVTTLRTDGSIFVRYLTGDEATLTIGKDGNAYLSQIGRKAESGMIALWGEKLFIPELYDQVLKSVGFPMQLEISHAISEDAKHQELHLTVYSHRFNDPVDERPRKDIEKIIADVMKNNPRFNRMLELGMLNLDIDFKETPPEGFHKGWRILAA